MYIILHTYYIIICIYIYMKYIYQKEANFLDKKLSPEKTNNFHLDLQVIFYIK